MKKQKTFVVGDIHGAYKALKQVLEFSHFDYGKDKLICLGDVADGWSQVPQCFEELLKIKNLVYVRGNHDQWLLEWMQTGKEKYEWISQGGLKSLQAYTMFPEFKDTHREFLEKSAYYYLDEKNRLFVHGGINPETKIPIEEQNVQELMWNRDLAEAINIYTEIKQYKEIYVGHTSIYRISKTPVQYKNVFLMDTGGGWEGVLSIMDIDTKKVWKSELVSDLYKGEKGR